MIAKARTAKAAIGSPTAKTPKFTERAKNPTAKHSNDHKPDGELKARAHAAPPKSKPRNSKAAEAASRKSPSATSQAGLSRTDILIKLLKTREGASIEQLADAVGWQHHSVRGALSGILKKRLGLTIISERVDDIRIYRIAK